jgi:glycosyltransferase involved in cell wall biosynthesis
MAGQRNGDGRPPYVVVTGDVVRTGGMDRANHGLVSWLARTGHEVHVVAYRVDEALRQDPNVTLHRVVKPAGAYVLGSPFLAAAGVLTARRFRGRRARCIANGGSCPIRGANWVHYVHAAYEAPTAMSGLRRYKDLYARQSALRTERLALRRARVVIANSERTRRDVIDLLGVPAERVHTVYYGIEPEAFRPATAEARAETRRQLGWPMSRPIAAFVGALGDRRKGFDVLFEAWKELCSNAAFDAELVVIGTGAELPAWIARAAAAGLDSRMRFLGFRRDVPAILGACDALVSPTRYEAYGLAVHEALCCAIPAIVSKSSGVAERYPSALADLLLDDPGDAAELAARIRGWYDRASSLAPAMRELSEQLRTRTWDVMARDITSLCEKDA